MKPSAFPQANMILTKPPDMSDEQCGSLQVHRSDGQFISCWSLTWRDMIRLLWTRRIWLWVLSDAHPPVAIQVESPFKKSYALRD